jgi:peroxiredoxin
MILSGKRKIFHIALCMLLPALLNSYAWDLKQLSNSRRNYLTGHEKPQAAIFTFGTDATNDTLHQFKLKTLKGKTIHFTELKNNKASLIVFLSPDCPLSQKYTLPIREYQEKYAAKGIKTYLVIPGTYYSKKVIREYVKTYKLDFPVLLDKDLRLARFMKASAVPEFFLTSPQASVIYSGKFDNWYESLGKNRVVITEKYLENATDAFLEGTPVRTSKTEPVGCIIQY